MSNPRLSFVLKILPVVMACAALLVVCYSFYLSLTLYSYFIIGRDEANFLLRSSMAIFSADTLTEALRQLFQIHGQHVLVGMQLANLLSFLVRGTLDFQFINFIGLLYLAIPSLLICLRLKFETYSSRCVNIFIIAVAIIFPLALSPAHISCAINTACTGNHYLGLGLAIVALSVFIPSDAQAPGFSRAALAEFFVLSAIFSSPAALAIIPLLFAIIFFFPTKKLSLLALHGIASLFILSAYFYIAEPADFSYLGNLAFGEAMKMVLMFGLFFFNVLGSVFFWPEQPLALITSVILGLAITTTGLWQIKSHWRDLPQRADLLFFASGFLLLLGMIGLIALGRLGTFGSTRYVFYGCFALIFLLSFLIACHRSAPEWKPVLLAIACLLYYPAQLALNQPYMERIRAEITSCNERWRNQGKACGVMMSHNDATALLLEAERQGILRLPRD